MPPKKKAHVAAIAIGINMQISGIMGIPNFMGGLVAPLKTLSVYILSGDQTRNQRGRTNNNAAGHWQSYFCELR